MQKFIDSDGKIHKGTAIDDKDEKLIDQLEKVIRRSPTYDYRKTALIIFSEFLVEKREKEIVTEELEVYNFPVTGTDTTTVTVIHPPHSSSSST